MTKKKAKCNLARNRYLLKSLVQQIHRTYFSQKSDLTWKSKATDCQKCGSRISHQSVSPFLIVVTTLEDQGEELQRHWIQIRYTDYKTKLLQRRKIHHRFCQTWFERRNIIIFIIVLMLETVLIPWFKPQDWLFYQVRSETLWVSGQIYTHTSNCRLYACIGTL